MIITVYNTPIVIPTRNNVAVFESSWLDKHIELAHKYLLIEHNNGFMKTIVCNNITITIAIACMLAFEL